jgi:hypothetical protein
MTAYNGRRCKAVNSLGEPCRSPVVRNGSCDVHRREGRAQELGRKGGLASAEARRRKREAIRLRKVELAAAKAAALHELHAAEERLRAGQERLRKRREEFRAEVITVETTRRERIARKLETQRRALQREATRLEALRDDIAVIDAEEWVRRRRELLEGRGVSAA